VVGLVAAKREPHTPVVAAFLDEAAGLAEALGPVA
jgi:hypothetical protein